MKRMLLPSLPLLLTLALFIPFGNSSKIYSQSFFSNPNDTIEDCACGVIEFFDTIPTTGLGVLGTDVLIDSVCLNISHSWTGDLSISLISPVKDTILLSEFNGDWGEDYTNTCFTSKFPATPISEGDAPFTGIFAPEETLNDLYSQSANGDWILNVCDDGCDDVGVVENWSIHFSAAPSCLEPYDVVVSDLDTEGASLSWESLPNAVSWEIEVVEADSTPTGQATISGIFTPVYHWTGGTSCTAYDLYFRSICGPGDTSAWSYPITVIPVDINDECINAIDVTSYINRVTDCDTLYSFYYDYMCATYSAGEDSVSADCPNFNLYPEVLDLWFKFEVPFNGYIEFDGMVSTLNGTIIELYTGTCGNLQAYQPTRCDFFQNEYFYGLTPGEIVYVRLWDNFNNSAGQITYCLKEVSCPGVASMHSKDPTSNGATVFWEARGPSPVWQIAIDTSNFPFADTPNYPDLSDTFFVFTDGQPLTKYDAYVRSICSAGDTSPWAGPFEFESICPIQTPPVFEDFYDFRPPCWREANGGNPQIGWTEYGESEWRTTNENANMAAVTLHRNTHREWLLSPYYDFSTGGPYGLVLDIRVAIQPGAGNASAPLGEDDTIHVIMSIDSGVTWQILETYTSADSIEWIWPGEKDTIDISSITESSVCFGIWASDGPTDDHPSYSPGFYLHGFEIYEMGDCEVNRIISGNPTSGVYKASHSITTTAKILNGRNVIFSAPNILLDPGFEVQPNASFKTEDDGCP